MPTRISPSMFRCRRPSVSTTLKFRPFTHDASHFSATRCGGSSGATGASGSCSLLSSTFAAWFWKTCIAVSLVPPAYVVYLLKRRFWDDRPPSSLDSVSPRLYYGDTVGVSSTSGTFHVQVIQGSVRSGRSGGGGYNPHGCQPVSPISRESGDTATSDQHQRFLKLKSTLEMLGDAGLSRELEERWQEREAERMQQRAAMKERKMKELGRHSRSAGRD